MHGGGELTRLGRGEGHFLAATEYTCCAWAGGTTEFSRLILLFDCLIRKNHTSTSSMNYTILLVSHFIHNSLHNSFLHIFYTTI